MHRNVDLKNAKQAVKTQNCFSKLKFMVPWFLPKQSRCQLGLFISNEKEEDLGEGLTFDASSLIENALNLFFSIYVTSVHSGKNPNVILIYKILDLHKKVVMQALSR